MMTEKIHTKLESDSICFLGQGILLRLGEELDKYEFDKLFLVTDTEVYGLYGQSLLGALVSRKFDCTVITCPKGERCKNISALSVLCEQLIEKGATKKSMLLALGGGSIGNLVGLAASLIFRGIRFVEVPTTMIAQTDSTFSNKQAINGNKGKNLYGVYYAPIFIWTDTDILLSENCRAIKGALAESVKNGLVADPEFLSYLDGKLDSAYKISSDSLYEIVHKSILSKIKIIERDPSEKMYAMVLEYGHTFGHAIEKLSNGNLNHGESISIGMIIAAKVSNKIGLLNDDGVKIHEYYLQERLNMPMALPTVISVDDMIYIMKNDNKRSSAKINYVLLQEIGRVANEENNCMIAVDETLIKEILSKNL